MQKRVPDISKLEALIGYEPNTTLDDMIRDVAGYQRSRRRLRSG